MSNVTTIAPDDVTPFLPCYNCNHTKDPKITKNGIVTGGYKPTPEEVAAARAAEEAAQEELNIAKPPCPGV